VFQPLWHDRSYGAPYRIIGVPLAGPSGKSRSGCSAGARLRSTARRSQERAAVAVRTHGRWQSEPRTVRRRLHTMPLPPALS